MGELNLRPGGTSFLFVYPPTWYLDKRRDERERCERYEIRNRYTFRSRRLKKVRVFDLVHLWILYMKLGADIGEPPRLYVDAAATWLCSSQPDPSTIEGQIKLH